MNFLEILVTETPHQIHSIIRAGFLPQIIRHVFFERETQTCVICLLLQIAEVEEYKQLINSSDLFSLLMKEFSRDHRLIHDFLYSLSQIFTGVDISVEDFVTLFTCLLKNLSLSDDLRLKEDICRVFLHFISPADIAFVSPQISQATCQTQAIPKFLELLQSESQGSLLLAYQEILYELIAKNPSIPPIDHMILSGFKSFLSSSTSSHRNLSCLCYCFSTIILAAPDLTSIIDSGLIPAILNLRPRLEATDSVVECVLKITSHALENDHPLLDHLIDAGLFSYFLYLLRMQLTAQNSLPTRDEFEEMEKNAAKKRYGKRLLPFTELIDITRKILDLDPKYLDAMKKTKKFTFPFQILLLGDAADLNEKMKGEKRKSQSQKKIHEEEEIEEVEVDSEVKEGSRRDTRSRSKKVRVH
jgi:hypothetical protein